VTAAAAALDACRFLHDAAAMLLWGGFAFLCALVPGALAACIAKRLARWRIAAVIVAAATTGVMLPLQAALIAGGWAAAGDPATLHALLLETSVGRAWQIEAAAALLLLSTLAAPARLRLPATAIAAGLVLASLSLTGHAVMQEGWIGAAHRLNDAVHLLAAGAWVGALVPLLPILRALDLPGERVAAEVALRRFSAAGHLAVALVLLTGVGNTLLVLGRWPTDWSSPYQALLSAKIAVVVVMVALALVNRYGFVPRLAGRRGAAAGALRRGTLAEIGLGLGAIGLVAVLGTLEP
jgi:putative copper resistance protein D